jgi:hypothetical protein
VGVVDTALNANNRMLGLTTSGTLLRNV